MIVQAFADGDKKALKPLLSREVFDGFFAAIDTRQRNGETLESKFVGIDNSSRRSRARRQEGERHGSLHFRPDRPPPATAPAM